MASNEIKEQGTATICVAIVLMVGVLGVYGSQERRKVEQQPALRAERSKILFGPDHVHHRPGSIVGAATPESIPDHAAYSLMLATIAGMQSTPDADRRMRSYFLLMEGTVARAVDADSKDVTLSNEDRSVIIAVAAELDHRTRELSAHRFGDAESKAAARLALVAAATERLKAQVSPSGVRTIEAFVVHRVKRNMKALM